MKGVTMVRILVLAESAGNCLMRFSSLAAFLVLVASHKPVLAAPDVRVAVNFMPITDGSSSTDALVGTDMGTSPYPQSLASYHPYLYVNIINHGDAPLLVSNVSFTGANASDFSFYSPPPADVSAGTDRIFIVQAIPSGSGARTATMHVNTNDPDTPDFDFALKVIGQTSMPGRPDLYGSFLKVGKMRTRNKPEGAVTKITGSLYVANQGDVEAAAPIQLAVYYSPSFFLNIFQDVYLGNVTVTKPIPSLQGKYRKRVKFSFTVPALPAVPVNYVHVLVNNDGSTLEYTRSNNNAPVALRAKSNL